MKFGDLVTDIKWGGVYMYIAPYTGELGTGVPAGPASWHADIDNDWTKEKPPSVTWSSDTQTEPLDE